VLLLPYLWVVVLFAQRKHLRMLAAFLVPVAVTFLYYFTVIQIMGMHARYYYPSIAFWIVPAVLILDDALRGEAVASTRGIYARVGVALILSVTLLMGGPLLVPGYAHFFMEVPPKTGHGTSQLPRQGNWSRKLAVGAIASEFPQGTTIAATEVGYLGAAAPQVTLIDLAGLNDNYLAHHGFSMQYLIERSPDFIWFPHWDYVTQIDTILKSAAFRRDYDYYCDAYDFGIAVKKVSPVRQAILEAIGRHWAVTYGERPMRSCDPLVEVTLSTRS